HTAGTFHALLGDGPVPESPGEGEKLPPGDVLSDDDTPTTRRSLREEANSVYHLLTHKPKDPYCDSCRRAKMKEQRKYAGSYQNTATCWGELVTGDHITSTHDNMLGIEGGKDVLVMRDAYSGLKAAYPMPDKSADSTMMAIQHFKR
ncbi:MAG: hypothetical protein ACKPKO_11020, partial [Candidatus Fonsibacter sp.]